MKENKTNTVFAVIDLSVSGEKQKNVVKYASELAQYLGLDLVLYPKVDNAPFDFKGGCYSISRLAEILGTKAHISDKVIGKFDFFKGIHDIAGEEAAEVILMAVEKKETKILGKDIYAVAKKSLIPVLLISYDTPFIYLDKITIAIDRYRKLEKMKLVTKIAKIFGSTINIFTENVKDKDDDFRISKGIEQVEKFLITQKIPFVVTKARKTENFPKNLCKFSAEYSNMLIIELDPGSIDSIVKQNIAMLLSIERNNQPVLIIKTTRTGRYQNFN